MKIVKFLTGLLTTIAIIYFAGRPITKNGTVVPGMATLINPFTGFWTNAEPLAPKPLRDVELQGLTEETQVKYDDRGIPHIFAENTHDALFAQGYVTAAHRLFQMDISSRATAGRLSEIRGVGLLPRDMEARRKGMLFAAQNAVAEWKKDKESWALLQAYCAGVNAYIQSLRPNDYPLEYKLIGTTPEEWSPLKTALFVKAMAADLAARHYDIPSTNSLHQFGRDTFDFLYPEYFEGQTPIIPPMEKWPFKAPKQEKDKVENDVVATFDYKDYQRPPANIGSNNWAVAGSRTESGHPILCGDPHLRLTLPSVWFEMQIKTPEFNAYGVTLPGIPFVVIGFNRHIAWTQTNVGHDVADLYQIKWKDADKLEYELDGEWKAAELRVDTFWVQNREEPVLDTVRYTIWGPVWLESPNSVDKDLAYQWLGHTSSTDKELYVFHDINKAKNYDEFHAALDNYNLPAQNYAFASRDGDIALRVTGLYPIKEKKQGRFVRDGSLSSSGWRGFVPKDHIPEVKNPPQGYVTSANQHSTDPSYPYYYHSERFEAFRGRAANEFLKEKDSIKLTVEDMMAMQNSNYDLRAAEALPLLLEQLDSNTIKGNPDLMKMLDDWDFHFNADSKAATFFNVWWQHVYRDTWDEVLGKEVALLSPKTVRTIHLLRDTPDSPFFDNRSTPAVETIKDIVTAAFNKTQTEMPEEGIPEWGDHKASRISNLANIETFTRPVRVGGTKSALNAMSENHGPSWRQIVILGDTMKAYVSYPGGQSGNPGSGAYDDFLQTWEAGEYYEAVFMRKPESRPEKIVRGHILKPKG